MKEEVRGITGTHEPVLLVQHGMLWQDFDRFDPALMKSFIFAVGERKQFGQLRAERDSHVTGLRQDAVLIHSEYRKNFFDSLFHHTFPLEKNSPRITFDHARQPSPGDFFHQAVLAIGIA